MNLVAQMRDAFTLQMYVEELGVVYPFVTGDEGGVADYTLVGFSPEPSDIAIDNISTDHPTNPAYIYVTFSSPPVTGQEYTLTKATGYLHTPVGDLGGNGETGGFDITFYVPEWGRTLMLKSFMPSSLDAAQPNLNALLTAFGYGDEWLGGAAPSSGAAHIRLATTISDAEGEDLNRVGTSYSVPRPPAFNGDEVYRQIIGLLGVSVKATRSRVTEFLNATVGASWGMYELEPGVLTIAFDVTNVTGSMESASYLHADATTASTGDYYGDYLQENEVTTDWGNMSPEDPARAVHLFAGDARQIAAIELFRQYMVAAGVKLRIVYNIIPTDNQTGLPSILPFTLPNT